MSKIWMKDLINADAIREAKEIFEKHQVIRWQVTNNVEDDHTMFIEYWVKE